LSGMEDDLSASENNAFSSSPKRLLSNETTKLSSPPSSPPTFPWEEPNSETQASKPQKGAHNAFSILGKRKPLESVCDNARPAKKRASTATPPPCPKDAKPLTQMHLSLGQSTQTRCKTCGMEFVPSLSEDRALHNKYHAQYINGVDVGKEFVSKARPRSIYYGAVSGDIVCAVDCFDKSWRKQKAQTVLEMVQRELGAVEIPQQDLWESRKEDGVRYRSYLYVRNGKCIGFLLTQRITHAYEIEKPVSISAKVEKQDVKELDGKATAAAALRARRQATQDRENELLRQPIQLSKTTRPAALGVARVWTASPYRRQGIAIGLLDAALEHHNDLSKLKISGKKRDLEARLGEGTRKELEDLNTIVPKDHDSVRKEDVAFSQPTESGTRLARQWFGDSWKWMVYVD
jgi:N-acetyltransferase